MKRGAATALVTALVGGGLVVGVASPAQAADATISIDSDGDRGTPQHYGSGWIYGLTENGQLPDRELLTEVGFNYNRAGGAQLDQGGGWRGGTYDRRFAATLAQYKTVESLGGRFVLLPHDLYGIDGVGGVGVAVPGNNGDWTDYDAFLTRLISDVKANNMTVEWDIWNEPDYPVFWPEPRTNPARFQQYLELWERTFNRLRSELPNAKIVGPSTNEGPDERDSWWRGYLDFVAAKNVVPDIISWHEIEGRYNGHDPVASKASLQEMLDRRGITKQVEFQVNEYAAPHQQYPAISAWYIARLERSNIHGLRSHWGSAQNLHNDAAQLLFHEGTTYFKRGEFQTYAEYASQGGTVVPVDTTTRNIDAYATRSTDGSTLTALIGSYNATGSVDIVADKGGPVQPGANVRVVVEKVIEGDGAENRGATFVSDSRATVGTDGKLSTNIRLDTSRDAYFVTIKKLGEESSLDGRLTFGSNLSAVRAGATTTVDTLYVNNGEERQDSVNLQLALPAGWSATTTQQQIGTVEPGQQRVISWQVTVPTNEISKRRVIETRASWTQDGSDLRSNVWAAYSVPCTINFLCESEEGAFTGGYLERNHDGYTGRGFIGGMLGQGARASLPFAVDAGGEYALRIRYAAGPDGPFAQANRTMTLIAGDRSRQIEFPRTATWASWGEVTVPVTLPAGTTDVALAANAGDTAWVNLDSVTLVRTGTTPTPGPSASPTPGPTTTPAPQGCNVGGTCEVETGTRAGGANIATNHTGFTGTGFIDGLVSPGASVTNSITAPTAGNHVLTIRYAAGPDGPFANVDRTASIVVNGTPQVVTLPKTATWGSWATTTTPITLPQGTSTIAVRIDQGNTGWINVDSLRADPAASDAVKVDATASTRKMAGKAYVAVAAVNRSSVPAQIEVVTAYGKKTFAAVRPGQTVSTAISSGNASIPAGKAVVTATATIDGNKVTTTVEALYNAQN